MLLRHRCPAAGWWFQEREAPKRRDSENNSCSKPLGLLNSGSNCPFVEWIKGFGLYSVLKGLTSGQVEPQQPWEAHRRHAGVQVGRRIAQELVRVWNKGSRWRRSREWKKVDEQWRFERWISALKNTELEDVSAGFFEELIYPDTFCESYKPKVTEGGDVHLRLRTQTCWLWAPASCKPPAVQRSSRDNRYFRTQ